MILKYKIKAGPVLFNVVPFHLEHFLLLEASLKRSKASCFYPTPRGSCSEKCTMEMKMFPIICPLGDNFVV